MDQDKITLDEKLLEQVSGGDDLSEILHLLAGPEDHPPLSTQEPPDSTTQGLSDVLKLLGQ